MISYLLSLDRAQFNVVSLITTLSFKTHDATKFRFSSSIIKWSAFSMQNTYNEALFCSLAAFFKKNLAISFENSVNSSAGKNIYLAAKRAVNTVLMRF
jgi:hypothetical protein